MAGPLQARCPHCGKVFPLPATVEHVDEDRQQALLRVDRTEAFGHLQQCPEYGKQEPEQEPRKLSERQPLDVDKVLGALRVKGPRPCTMCGTTNDACMELLTRKQACCASCGEGNTHPTAAERQGCAEWGATHGA